MSQWISVSRLFRGAESCLKSCKDCLNCLQHYFVSPSISSLNLAGGLDTSFWSFLSRQIDEKSSHRITHSTKSSTSAVYRLPRLLLLGSAWSWDWLFWLCCLDPVFAEEEEKDYYSLNIIFYADWEPFSFSRLRDVGEGSHRIHILLKRKGVLWSSFHTLSIS